MFDIGSSELLLIVVVAIVVIGPKDLPRALYKLGQVIGKARGMARHFRSGVDAMIREAELEELQKQWAKENERIMSASSLPDMTAVTPYDPEAAPNPAIAEAAASDGFKPFQTDVAPADSSPAAPLADPEQPALPLDASPNDAPAADAPKGSPA